MIRKTFNKWFYQEFCRRFNVQFREAHDSYEDWQVWWKGRLANLDGLARRSELADLERRLRRL